MKSETAGGDSAHRVTARRGVLDAPVVDELIDFLEPNPKFDAVLRLAKGAVNRVALYYHASYLEHFGKTPPYGSVPAEAVQRIASILDVEVSEPFEYPPERRTFFKHAEKARQVLGWYKFNRGFRSVTQEWLDVEARRSDDPDYLQQILESRLRTDRVIPPARSSIERIIAQARTTAQEHVVDVIANGLSDKQKERIDKLRGIKRGTRRSHLQWIKDSPGNASPRVLKDLLERIAFIRGIGLSNQPFEEIHPDMRRRLTATVQVYSVDSLFGDLSTDKRHAYMACYLYQRLSGKSWSPVVVYLTKVKWSLPGSDFGES